MTTIEYTLNGPDPTAGNAAGVFIDGAIYTLQGEPPIAKGGSWFTFHAGS
jgi:hypothetical protein